MMCGVLRSPHVSGHFSPEYVREYAQNYICLECPPSPFLAVASVCCFWGPAGFLSADIPLLFIIHLVSYSVFVFCLVSFTALLLSELGKHFISCISFSFF